MLHKLEVSQYKYDLNLLRIFESIVNNIVTNNIS